MSEASINKWIREELTHSKFEFIKDSITTYSEKLFSLYIGYNCTKMSIKEIAEIYDITTVGVFQKLQNAVIEMQKVTGSKLYRLNVNQKETLYANA